MYKRIKFCLSSFAEHCLLLRINLNNLSKRKIQRKLLGLGLYPGLGTWLGTGVTLGEEVTLRENDQVAITCECTENKKQ